MASSLHILHCSSSIITLFLLFASKFLSSSPGLLCFVNAYDADASSSSSVSLQHSVARQLSAAPPASIQHYPHNVTTVQKLASITLRAALEIVHKSRELAKTCLKTQKEEQQQGIHVLERQAVEDCEELMGSAHEQLNLAIENLMSSVDANNSHSQREAAFEDLNVRLSTALSYQETCNEGFQFVRSGKCKRVMEGAQEEVWEVLGESLRMVKKLWRNERKGRKAFEVMKLEMEEKVFAADVVVAMDGSGHYMSITEALEAINGCIINGGSSRGINGGSSNSNSNSFINGGGSKSNSFINGGGSKSSSSNSFINGGGSNSFINGGGSNSFINGGGSNSNSNSNSSSFIINGCPFSSEFGPRIIVYIKQGIYHENLTIPKTLANLTLFGDGINLTIITANNNVSSGLFNTFRTSTVGILADGFMARDITFQNTAGPLGYQAVALKVSGDMAVFYRCSFEGYQDTLYALAGRQFYRDCKIYGTVDFIFGNAIASFQTCEILARRPLPGQKNTMTAQGRQVADDISGFSFQNCTFQSAEDMVAMATELNSSYTVHTYLGRPWKAFSRTVILQSFLGSIIDATGWLPWNASNPFSDTVYYGEFQNYGPGSSIANRVTWLGVHPALNASEALQFTADNFISGSSWLPLSQVSYSSGLSSDSQH